MRIDWREYKEQSKRVGKQRESKERERAERVSKVFLCFFTWLLYLLSNAMNCLTNMYEAHGWMITVYQHDYSYGKSKIPKHEADRKKESINRVERRVRVQL